MDKWVIKILSDILENDLKSFFLSNEDLLPRLKLFFTHRNAKIRSCGLLKFDTVPVSKLQWEGDLLIEISSFSLSHPLLQCFNRQASKRNNLAKERVANVPLGVVEGHVPYTRCPPVDITVIINIIIIINFFLFLATKILWRPFYNWRSPKGDFLKKWARSAAPWSFLRALLFMYRCGFFNVPTDLKELWDGTLRVSP